MQLKLSIHPDSGVLIKQSGGIRKLRWAGSGRGKRGGIIIIYYYYGHLSRIYFLYAYTKNETADLTPKQIIVLKSIIQED